MTGIFEFTRVDGFLDNINRESCFDTNEMDGTSLNFKFVPVSSCPYNIEDCIDEDGTLSDKVNIIQTYGDDDGKCSFLWSKGINGERTMSCNSSVVNYDMGDTSAFCTAMFLVEIGNGTGYVIAYAINNKGIELKGNPMFPTDGIVWSFGYGD